MTLRHLPPTPSHSRECCGIPAAREPHLDPQDARILRLQDEPTGVVRRRRWVLEEKLKRRLAAEHGRAESASTERLRDLVVAHRIELRRRRQATGPAWHCARRWSP